MKIISFIAELGNLDSQGNQVVLTGLNTERLPIITANFDATKVIGICQACAVTDNGLEVTAKVDASVVDGYPAIGFIVEEYEENEHGGKTFTKSRLRQVSISANPNTDPAIKSISEQLQPA